MRLFILLFLLSAKVLGQEIFITDSPDPYITVSDSENRTMYYLFYDHYVKIDLNTMERVSKPLTLEKDFIFGPFYIPVVKNSNIYLLLHYGGLVYTLKNDSIQRIDKSYEHKMQNGAAVFVHDDKIFRYGGYGFWSVHNVFTYLSDETNEWEYAAYKNHEVEAPDIFSMLTIKSDENIFFFNGYTLDPMDRIKWLPSKEVWKYSLADEKWTYLGISNWSRDRSSMTLNYADKGDLKYVFQDNRVMEIDPERNLLRVYEQSPISKLGDSKVQMMFDDQIVYSSGDGKSLYLGVVPSAHFFGKKIFEGKFYTSSWKRFLPYALYLLGAVVLLFFVKWLIKLRKRKTKAVMLSNGLSYKNKFTEFDKETMEILTLLLSDKRIPSSEILKIVEKEQFSPAHNERIKVQKVNDLNIKLQTLFGEKEAMIKSVKSKEDRRIRVYTLDRTYF